MIKGNKPSAYGSTKDENGREVVIEFRQCSHCQASWQYVPGMNFGRRVSLCDYCQGLLCEFCTQVRWQSVDHRCVPFSEGVESNGQYVYNPNLSLFLRK